MHKTKLYLSMLLESSETWIYLLLPIIAFLYASVGHGGASGYLALMALFGFSATLMKPTALTLNLFVAAISFYHFWKQGHFRWQLLWPFALASVPAAFAGGLLELDPIIYKRILGVLLLFAILRMLNFFKQTNHTQKPLELWHGLISGALIGFFSGLIGIGGGIILSPLILFMGWGKIKEAAAVSALFIWINSAAGLAGHLSQGASIPDNASIYIGLALIGGFAGGYIGSRSLDGEKLRYILAFVLVIASFKLIFV
jgi:hypothetical protein